MTGRVGSARPWRRQRLAVAMGSMLVAPVLLPAQTTPVTARADSAGFVVVKADGLTYGTTGTSQQIISGDPSKPGLYVIRIRFAPGQTSKPHFHDQDRYVTVIKGTWWISLGPGAAAYDTSKMIPMKAGSFVKHPAGGVHFDGAKDEEAIVQIIGMGPVKSIDVPRPPGTPSPVKPQPR